MTRKLISTLTLLTLFALPALAQVAPGTPVAPAVHNFAPRYSPDGKFIAFLRGNDAQHAKELWVMDADGKNARRLLSEDKKAKDTPGHGLLPSDSFTIYHYIWAPNSKSIACQIIYAEKNMTVKGWGWRTRLDRIFMDGTIKTVVNSSNIQAFTLSPDGKSVVVLPEGSMPGMQDCYLVYSFDKVNERSRILNCPPDLESSQPFWGTDGRIYFSAKGTKEENKYADIYAIEKDGKITQITDTKYADETSPSLSPDGKTLAFLRNGTLVLRNQATGEEKHSAHTNGYRWLPDGRILASTQTIDFPATRYSCRLPDNVDMTPTSESSIQIFSAAGDCLMMLFHVVVPEPERVFPPPYMPPGLPQVSIIDAHAADPLPLPDISPDGKRLVYEKDGTLYLTDMPVKAGI